MRWGIPLRKNKHRNPPASALLSAMQIPADLSYRESVLTFYGGRELYVENYQKILRYEPECICILSKTGRIQIEGSRLMISYYSGEEMKIVGQIQSVRFEA